MVLTLEGSQKYGITHSVSSSLSCDSPPNLASLGHIEQHVLEEGVHLGSASHVLAEQGLEHTPVGAEERGQTHEQARVVHHVAGPGHTDVLMQQLLDNRVELVNGAWAGQAWIACIEETNKGEDGSTAFSKRTSGQRMPPVATLFTLKNNFSRWPRYRVERSTPVAVVPPSGLSTS
ncbi:hypothetical protein PoB_003369000 [Plakobranchus ocellatus]|uniref:Uncharacterized protein n=1 Tax=Plakobranchus ocellatus TaxID=259542 RepID=A0AAV4AK08_9GAST|nr:hypothetical protein PoB_003369000 [Plakobranchus ocellatus]